jgi:hypothetical protein
VLEERRGEVVVVVVGVQLKPILEWLSQIGLGGRIPHGIVVIVCFLHYGIGGKILPNLIALHESQFDQMTDQYANNMCPQLHAYSAI